MFLVGSTVTGVCLLGILNCDLFLLYTKIEPLCCIVQDTCHDVSVNQWLILKSGKPAEIVEDIEDIESLDSRHIRHPVRFATDAVQGISSTLFHYFLPECR